MNAFVEHHNNSIQFGYRCFDRLLLNGLIQPFQQPERVLGFFNAYRDGQRAKVGHLGYLSSFGQTTSGEIVGVTYGGTVYRMVASAV